MKPMTIRRTVLAIALVATSGWGPDVAQGQAKLSEKQATDIGAEVYIYGYPLVTLEMTRRVTPIQPSLLACVPRWANSHMPGNIRL
jgi:hypothetical protein